MWDSFTALVGLLLMAVAGGLLGPVLGIVSLIRQSEVKGRLLRLEREVAELREALAREVTAPASPAMPGTAARPATDATGSAGAEGHRPATAEAGAGSVSPPPPRARTPTGQPLVWIGGIALALAGLLAVVQAVEQGRIGPGFWLSGLALLGLGAFAAALALHRRGEGGAVPQALAGAGLVTLFATLHAAGNLFALIPPALAFALGVLTILAALAAGLALGTPVLLLGAVGAYAAPLLGDYGATSPLPFWAYLGFVTLLIGTLAWARGSVWLSWIPPLGLQPWFALSLLAIPWSLADRPVVVTGPTAWSWDVALFGLLATRPELWAMLRAGIGPRSFAQRLAHHLLHLAVAVVLLAGWLAAQPGVDPPLLAVLAVGAPLSLAAAAGGAGSAAVLPAALVAVAATWTVDIRSFRLAELLPDPAVGLDPLLWVPPGGRRVLVTALVLAVAFATSGHLLARSGRDRPVAAAAAALVPLLLLIVTRGRLQETMGDGPFAATALALAALATAGTADLLVRGRPRAAGLEALAAFAAVATGAAFHLPTAELPVALAVVPLGGALIARRLPLPEVTLATGLVGIAALLALLREALRLTAAESLDHALLAYALPALVLTVTVQGPVRGRPVPAEVLAAVRDGAAFTTLAALVLVANGTAPTLAADPILAPGLALALWLRFTHALLRLAPHLPSPAHRSWILPATAAFWPALALLVGEASPLRWPWDVGVLPLWDSLLVAALLPTLQLALLARDLARGGRREAAGAVAALALAGLLWWLLLEIRHLFHGPILGPEVPWTAAEHLTLTLAWTAVAVILAVVARQWGRSEARAGAVAVGALVAVKLFWVDVAELGGTIRVLALAGAGAGLLLLGWLVRGGRSTDAAE